MLTIALSFTKNKGAKRNEDHVENKIKSIIIMRCYIGFLLELNFRLVSVTVTRPRPS